MGDVADAKAAMVARFNPAAAAGLDVIFGFRIDDIQNYALIVKDGTCVLQEGENPDADVTLVMGAETLKGIIVGETDGMQAFMAGKMRVEGDMMLSMKLSELFPG
jgi:putative sterol carrier protein